jgi:hypothetical protein
MTLKSRLLGLVTILVLLMTAPSTFAQVTLTVTDDTSSASTEIATSRNAQTAIPGDANAGVGVSGSFLGAGSVDSAILRLAYPGTITSGSGLVSTSASTLGTSGLCNTGLVVIGTVPTSTGTNYGEVACPVAAVPTGDPIRIVGQAGLFTAVSNPVVNTSLKRIEIVLPSSSAPGGSGFFKLVGVRIDANGLTGAQSLTASLNDVAKGYNLSTSTVQIINGFTDGIGAYTTGTVSSRTSGNGSVAGAGTIFTNGTVPKASFTTLLTEGFASAWRTKTDESNTSTGLTGTSDNPTQIRLTFAGVPSGVTLSIGTDKGTGSGNLFLSVSLSNTSITSSNLTTIISINGESTSATESFEVDGAISTPTSTSSLTAGSPITVTATLYPLGDGVTTTGTGGTGTTTPQGIAREDQGYPAFVEKDYGPLTIVNIVQPTTTMLMPFAFAGGSYDTGIAIANTTKDPFSVGSSTPTGGTMRFDFFPTTATGTVGTTFSLTSSATILGGKDGLDSSGSLPPGGTFTDTLTDLLRVAGAPTSFTGYVFVTTQFLDAHGVSYVSADGFKTNTLNSILVLPPPATSSRNTPTNSVESLGF